MSTDDFPPNADERPRPPALASARNTTNAANSKRNRSGLGRYGDYYLIDQIGNGGMAEVFRAVRSGPEGFLRTFVIKRIKPTHAGSEEFVQMFCEEARISAMLTHPNIVQVYEFGRIEGTYFLAMEYVRGKDLLSVMRALRERELRLSPSIAAYIAQQVALGLAYVHAVKGRDGKPLNLVHRDINPANIMLLKTGGVKILDFGIAKTAAPSRTKTQAGFVKGKLGYLSPEQARCAPLDGRSDVFSLGVTLWESLTGKPLFRRGSDYETVKNVLDGPVEPPSRHHGAVPSALDDIVMRALARDVNQRYASARDMARDLADFLRDVRFSDDEIVTLLREIFGEHSSQVIPIYRDPPGLDASDGVRRRAGSQLPALRESAGAPGFSEPDSPLESKAISNTSVMTEAAKPSELPERRRPASIIPPPPSPRTVPQSSFATASPQTNAGGPVSGHGKTLPDLDQVLRAPKRRPSFNELPKNTTTASGTGATDAPASFDSTRLVRWASAPALPVSPAAPPASGFIARRGRDLAVAVGLTVVTVGSLLRWVAPALATETADGGVGNEAVTGMVSVAVDSTPPGAEVTDQDGHLLGITPVVITVARSEDGAPVRLNARKESFSPVVWLMKTDTDSFVSLELLPQP